MSFFIVPMWLMVQPPASSRVSAPAARPVVEVLFMTTTWKLFGSGSDPVGGADDDDDDEDDGDDGDGGDDDDVELDEDDECTGGGTTADVDESDSAIEVWF